MVCKADEPKRLSERLSVVGGRAQTKTVPQSSGDYSQVFVNECFGDSAMKIDKWQ